MATDTLTRTDAEIEALNQLLEEHEIPCEWSRIASWDIPDCPSSADWLLTLVCAECGPRRLELCGAHRDELARKVRLLNQVRVQDNNPHVFSITDCEPLH